MKTTDTILLLVNDEAERENLQNFLEENGYLVQIASKIDDSALKYTQYSLIIIDPAIAQENIKKLQIIRQRLNHIFIPLLIMLPEKQEITTWLQSGCDDVLRIPLRNAEFSVRLKNLLELRKQFAAQFETCLEVSNDAVFILDDMYNIMDCNSTVEKFYGYKKDELIGKNIVEVRSPEERQNLQTQMDQVLAGDKKTWESIQLCKNGTTFIAEISSKSISSGSHKEFYHVVRDITERKKIASDLQRLHDGLETQIKQRTMELVNMNAELESFSYSVAHDLRSPLRAIDGFSQVILDDYSQHLSEEGKGYLERVRAATKRMSTLIGSLLEFSRLSRVAITIENVSLSDIINEVIKELQDVDPASNTEFIVEEDLFAKADKPLIKLVLENLISNAIKFSSKNASRRIEFGSVKDPVKGTIYFVRDNGAGFNMEYADKLFSPFQRLHKTTEFPGTGVGLATVQRIIKRHGGSIWAESATDKGATFYFTLAED